MYDTDHESRMTYDIVAYKPRRKRRALVVLSVVCLACASLGLSFGAGVGLGSALGAAKSAATAPLAAVAASPAADVSDSHPDQTVRLVNSPATLAFTNGVVDVVKQSADSVVSITTTVRTRTFFNRLAEVPAAGSGIIIGEDEQRLYIATNNHVINGAKQVMVSVDDSKQVNANYVGAQYESDLAVISVLKSDMSQAGVDYRIANTGNSDRLQIGEVVVAIGNPLGEGKTATMGIVSAKDRQLNIEGRTITVLQTDAAINPGNSGGALVNMNGEVIGINTAKLADAIVEGMGYSIPINEALVTIERLINEGSAPQRAYLGIQGVDVDEELRQINGLPSVGVYVMSVQDGSGAAQAGLRRGDIIIGLVGKPIETMEDLQEILSDYSPGDTVELTVYRGTERASIRITLQNLVGW